MKRIVSVTAVFLCGISLLQAQPVRVSETLKELDMENISVVEKSDTITAAFETSAYEVFIMESVLPYAIWSLYRKYRLCSYLY